MSSRRGYIGRRTALTQSPEELQPAPAIKRRLGVREPNRAQLLELRTENGPVYVFPSWWQRIRLCWTFRHFHVLPPQVLSRRDQRLIEKLSRSAIVTPTLPVASNTVFGVVEKVRSKPPASANRVVPLRTELATMPAFPANSEIPDLPDSKHLSLAIAGKQRESRNASGQRVGWGVGEIRLWQWGVSSAIVAVCAALILAWVYGASLFPGRGQMERPRTVSAPTVQAANGVQRSDLPTSPVRVSPATARLPNPPKPTHLVAPLLPESTLPSQKSVPSPSPSGQSIGTGGASTSTAAILEPAENVPSGASDRLFVSELPQGHFAYPVVPERNLVGELQLKALVGADGSVKDVTVLSGDPKLAEAGMRAVRQWRFTPYQARGGPVEVETQIKMKFFGQDAVSITSVANSPTSARN